MPLSDRPGPWRWDKRDGSWWRVHQTEDIEEGPYTWDDLNLDFGGFGGAHNDWYDRDGEPVPILVAMDLTHDPDYKIVKQDVFVYDDEPVMVSTVWLALNHNWWPDSPPQIFETMIFGGRLDLECWRYSTDEQARAGHLDAVKLVHATYAEKQ